MSKLRTIKPGWLYRSIERAHQQSPDNATHINAWHEDHGNVLWWTRPVKEPPWVGTPLDNTWPGYHRWWTPLPAAPTTFTPSKRAVGSCPLKPEQGEA